ncbi:MAG: PhnD/SsuA/transferrin family substrate-binding protein, partial [Nitratireductor sp.]
MMRKILMSVLFGTCATLTLSSHVNAEWQKDIGTLRVGLVTGENISQNLNYAEPFKLALQDALGINVELYPAKDYASLVTAHTEGRVEYAILSASAYAATHVN